MRTSHDITAVTDSSMKQPNDTEPSCLDDTPQPPSRRFFSISKSYRTIKSTGDIIRKAITSSHPTKYTALLDIFSRALGHRDYNVIKRAHRRIKEKGHEGLVEDGRPLAILFAHRKAILSFFAENEIEASELSFSYRKGERVLTLPFTPMVKPSFLNLSATLSLFELGKAAGAFLDSYSLETDGSCIVIPFKTRIGDHKAAAEIIKAFRAFFAPTWRYRHDGSKPYTADVEIIESGEVFFADCRESGSDNETFVWAGRYLSDLPEETILMALNFALRCEIDHFCADLCRILFSAQQKQKCVFFFPAAETPAKTDLGAFDISAFEWEKQKVCKSLEGDSFDEVIRKYGALSFFHHIDKAHHDVVERLARSRNTFSVMIREASLYFIVLADPDDLFGGKPIVDLKEYRTLAHTLFPSICGTTHNDPQEEAALYEAVYVVLAIVEKHVGYLQCALMSTQSSTNPSIPNTGD